jgi:hypothetical protein
MKENRGSTVLSLLILIVIAGAAYYIVENIRQTTQQTVAPFQQANSSLQTQVADLLHPTPTIFPDPVTYINQIQALARLETIQYSVQQVMHVDSKQGTFAFLFGNQMLLQVQGTVIAGIDMQKVQAGDLQMQNGILHVKLPPTEVFITTLDESKTQVYNVQTGVFYQPDPNDVIQGLVGAKDQILKAALADGILEHAQQNAVTYLTRFFAALGYPNAVLESTPAD